MNSFMQESTFIGVAISLLAYVIGLQIHKKTKKAILNPLLISILLVILFLLIFDIDYNNYNGSAKYLSYLLTPATVCLAIPLYRQINLLKKNFLAIIIGITIGVITSLSSILALAMLFKLSHQEYVTFLPKSITTAIGMGVSEELGGFTTITIASIITTGILGNIIAPLCCKWFRLKTPIAKGLAIGTASHAIGTTKALEMGEIEGAMSSLAIVISGLLTVVLASIFAMFY